jgi:DNA-binding transcriptional regulator YiaG
MTPKEFKQHRKALGITAIGLARLFGMGINYRQQIRKWENGQVKIPGWASLIMDILISRQIPDLKQFQQKRKK